MSFPRILSDRRLDLSSTRSSRSSVVALFFCCLAICVAGIAPSEAGRKSGGSSSDYDDWKEQKWRQAEEAREARERAREAEQRAREAEERARAAEELRRIQEQKKEAKQLFPSASGNVRSGSSSTSNQYDRQKSGDAVKSSESSSTSSNRKKKDAATRSDESREITDRDDDAPPPTVEKWLKRLSEPATKPVEEKANALTDKTDRKVIEPVQAITEKDPIGKIGLPKPAIPKPAIAKPAIVKPATARLPAGGRPEPIEFLEVPLPEVLAVNATAATVARAKSLGFTAAPATSLASLNLSVTRLLAPQGMSPSEAQALLQTQVPGGSFAPNMKYRIYKTAAASLATKPSGVPPTPSSENLQSCGGDRCFAQNIIGWKPELRKCAAGVKVGIIDTSVDISHPTFKRKQIEVRHFGPKDKPGPDWHGTGVAALLAGDDKSATPGLIPDASFYIADIFYAGEDKAPASDTLSMLRAFNWLEANGVMIINMSLSGPPDALIEAAVSKLAAKGILLVAAAGNDGPNNAGPSYPAAYDNVIAVTAVNKNMQNYRYANRGSYVDIAAPGVAIWTALPGSQHGYHSGTSFATPYVTASLAAIYSRIGGQKPNAVLQSLAYRDLGDEGTDPVYGRGLLVAPASCTGGQIAAAPVPEPAAPASAPSTFLGFFEPASAPPAPEHTEQLPWLSLGGAQQ